MSINLELLQKVKTEAYITEYYYVSEDTRYLRHFLSEKVTTENFEVWPTMWMFSYGQIENGLVKIRVGANSKPLTGNVGVLIPARSPLTWIVEPRLFESEAVFSIGPFPKGFSTDHVHIVEFDKAVKPRTAEQVCAVLTSDHVRSIAALAHCDSPRAAEMKDELDVNHLLKRDMQSIASSLAMSREAFTRKFKQYFGVSPLAYQNRMKVSAAFEKLIFSDHPTKITDVSFESGFDSFSSFNKQFKKFVKATPSDYAIQAVHH